MSLMHDFFKSELKTLQLKTGIRQLETMASKSGWEKDMETLINFMVDECNKPPFDVIGIDVKQRVIAAAIVEDKDFIGMNAKFVRRALSTWWTFNKDKYFEKIQNSQSETTEVHEPVSPEKRQEWLQKWMDSLEETKIMTVPKMSKKEIIEEGGWLPKGSASYPQMSEAEVRKHERHVEWIKANFDPRTGEKLEGFVEEKDWIN